MLIRFVISAAKSDADLKHTLKLPPAPTKSPVVKKTTTTSHTTTQVPVIELNRVDQGGLNTNSKLLSVSEEEELLGSDEEMETDQTGREDNFSSGEKTSLTDVNLTIPPLNPINPLELNFNNNTNLDEITNEPVVVGQNKIVVQAQVHAVNDQSPKVPQVDYDSATHEEKDCLVFNHIQDQNREISLLKNTISKLLDEKKTILKQQSETVCDMNLLKERLRVAESVEEMEVIKNRMKELQNLKAHNKIKINEKNENLIKTYKNLEKHYLGENTDSETPSTSSDCDESEFILP